MINGKSQVAIILAFYNGVKEYLADAIESILNQTYENIRLLLVDDGSTDGVYDIALYYKKAFPNKIRLIKMGKNEGLFVCRNIALCLTDAPFVGFQDADDISDFNRIKVELDFLNSHYEVDMASCYFFNIFDDNTIKLKFYNISPNFRLGRFKSYGEPNLTTALLRRSVFNQLGFFYNTRFGGDSEFLKRMVYLSQIRVIPQVLYFRRKREESLTGAKETSMKSEARKSFNKNIIVKKRKEIESYYKKDLEIPNSVIFRDFNIKDYQFQEINL